MRCYRASLLALALACGSTAPGDSDSHVPQIGRYDYRLDHEGVHLIGDLVISEASPTQIRYRFFIEGSQGSNTLTTVQYSGTAWLVNAWFPSRSAANLMVRDGNSYRCTATVLRLTTFSPGTCSFTFEGPDSVRVAP